MSLYTTAGTQLSETDFNALTTAVPVDDPLVEVSEDIYEDFMFPGEQWPASGMRLKFRAGQRVRQSEIDALFVAATIASVSPSSGPAAGGTAVTIAGTGFTVGSTVTFGGTAATDVAVNSAEEITCTTPAGTAGAVDVAVTTDSGTVTATGAYTYV